jgi:hypothetical protein
MATLFSFNQMLLIGFVEVLLLTGFILRANTSFFQPVFYPNRCYGDLLRRYYPAMDLSWSAAEY